MHRRHRNLGTGLHRYWYIRAIMLLLTLVLPFGALMFVSLNFPHVLTYDVIFYSILGWFVYLLIVVVICLKIESVLEAKRKRQFSPVQEELHRNGVGSSNGQKVKIQNTPFGQMQIIIGDADDDDDEDEEDDADADKSDVFCPKCRSSRVVKTDAGLYVCMKCACRFEL